MHCFKEERVGGSASLATDAPSVTPERGGGLPPSTMTQTKKKGVASETFLQIFSFKTKMFGSEAKTHKSAISVSSYTFFFFWP